MSKQLRSIKSAVVKISDRCNQDCPFCLDKGVTPKMHMTVKEINELLDRLKLDCDQLIFMGGETLLVKNFEQVVKHAKQIGYRAVGIATNGTLLSKDNYLDRLVDGGLDYLEFSLQHHEKEKVNQLSGRSFTWDRINEALELMDKRAFPDHFFVLFNIVMNSVNRHDLLPTVKFVNERYPNFNRRFNFKSMVLRGSAAKNEFIQTRYVDTDMIPAFTYLEENGYPFWTENVPLCAAPGFEWHSLNLATRVFNRTYKDIDFENPDEYYDTGFHDTGKIQPGCCDRCTLRAECLGIEINYVQTHGSSEFTALSADPVEVVGKVLADAGADPCEAQTIHDGLQRFFQLGPYHDRNREYLYFRQGGHRRATFVLQKSLDGESRPLFRAKEHQLVFMGDGSGDVRQPREDEIELMKSLGRSILFMEKHHSDGVFRWVKELKSEFEKGTVLPDNWVLLPESRYMEYY